MMISGDSSTICCLRTSFIVVLLIVSRLVNRVIREVVGDDCQVMVDANQKWSVNEAIEWMKQLVQFKITWIEEPTSPGYLLFC